MKTIFISGPHGSGKTTMINKLIEMGGFEENKLDFDFINEFKSFNMLGNFERTLTRLYHRYFITQSRTNDTTSDKIKLVSRGIYDSRAYIETYQQYSMFDSDNEYMYLTKVLGKMQMDDVYTIILNPDVDVIMHRLGKRRNSNQRPKRDEIFKLEDTEEFLIKMTGEFEKYRNDKNVLYITNNENENLDEIIKWVNETLVF